MMVYPRISTSTIKKMGSSGDFLTAPETRRTVCLFVFAISHFSSLCRTQAPDVICGIPISPSVYLEPTCKSSRNHSLTVVARKLLLSRARKKVRKNRPQAAEAGETARPNARNTGLAVVAQALSPAAFDFFSPSKQAVPEWRSYSLTSP